MIFEPIFTVALITLAGYIAARFVKLDLEQLSNVIVYVTGPALSFVVLAKRQFGFSEFVIIGGATLWVLAVSYVATLAYLRWSKSKARGLIICGTFMNSSFLAFPVALLALGEAGLGRAVVYDLFNLLLLYTLGVYMISKGNGRERMKDVLGLPFVYAALLGLAVSVSHFNVPQLVMMPLETLGNATIPLALVMIGVKLATLKARHVKDSLAVALIRMLGGFGAGWLFVSALGVKGIVAQAIILTSSMPPAVTTYVFNQKFKASPDEAASAVFFGTLLSFIFLFFVLSFIGA